MKQFIIERIWKCDICKCLLKENEVEVLQGDWNCIKCHELVNVVYFNSFEKNAEG